MKSTWSSDNTYRSFQAFSPISRAARCTYNIELSVRSKCSESHIKDDRPWHKEFQVSLSEYVAGNLKYVVFVNPVKILRGLATRNSEVNFISIIPEVKWFTWQS